MTTSTFEMTPVQSTMASSVGYNSNTSTLRILFLNGAMYDYYKVDWRLAMSFMNNESIGKSYNQLIRGQYSCTRIA